MATLLQPLYFSEDNNARNGSRKKKQWKANTKMGEIHHRYVWQQRAEWRRTRIIFAETYRREERKTFETRPIVLKNSVLNETDPYASPMVNILNKSYVYICH